VLTFFKKTIDLVLDYIFPQPIFVRRIEKMTTEECLKVMEPCFAEIPLCKPIFKYSNPTVRTAVREVKYRGNRKIVEKFGEILYTVILIPICSSRAHKKEKGFNQTELLAEAVVLFDTNDIFEYKKNILIRTKDTVPQTKTKNKEERLKNPIGSFGIKNTSQVKGRNVILIDDVITTGSTIKEAKKALKKAGARKVIAYAVAH
jgi:ComF family protein